MKQLFRLFANSGDIVKIVKTVIKIVETVVDVLKKEKEDNPNLYKPLKQEDGSNPE
jgi:hypothetical protein